MLEAIGDILNWTAAGVMFPLMLLPLAALASVRRTSSTVAWAGLVVITLAAGVIFAAATPVLRATPSIAALAVFCAFVTGLGVLIFLQGGAGETAKKLAPPLQAIATGAGRGVMWLLLVMALVQFAVVLLRYVFGVNWIFMQESVTYMHGLVFLIAAGYALLTNDHVRVDIFYRDAPPKRKALVDLAGTYLFLFPICIVILWAASPYVARSWGIFEGSADRSGIKGVFILKSLILAFAVLLAMAGFVIAHKAVAILKGRDA